MELPKDVASRKINCYLKTCRDFVETLSGKISQHTEVLKWFKQLCQHLTKVIMFVSKINQTQEGKIDKGTRDILILYCTQLLTALSLLINVFVRETEVEYVLTEARYCALKQIVWCLNGIEDAFSGNSVVIDPSGSFIKWMDSALDKIGEVDLENNDQLLTIATCNEAKVLFEEVLSHAMSIAQVALVEDCKIIKGSSQTVLEAMDSLTKEINSQTPNSAMANLFVDTCTDKLCALENKVNTAVLKLSLKVFSEFTKTLDKIHMFCLNNEHKTSMDQLDVLVADFDLHVDQIMQIGLFAVSCSTCVNRCVKIRSCLASLEALESELVPAFTSVLLENSTHNVNYAMLLKNHWLHQANMLQKLIYLIIDPFAFCQIIYEENKLIVEKMSEAVASSRKILDKDSVEGLLKNSNVLQFFVNTIIKEIEENNIKSVKASFNDFKNVLHEVKSASANLLAENLPNQENSLRVLKRCKILLTTIKRLWFCFSEEEIEIKQETKLDKNNETDTKKEKETKNLFLEHIIKRGQQILKDRSVLYRSSTTKGENLDLKENATEKKSIFKVQNKSIPLSKLVHLRKLSFMSSMVKNESTIDLQITDILNELTSLSNSTFNK